MTLYSRSLEAHLNAYMNDVILTARSQDFQLAQNRIVREAELLRISQADTINKLAQLQAERLSKAPKDISLSTTASPDGTKQSENKDSYKPYKTPSEYEGLIPKIKQNTQGKLLQQELTEKLKKENLGLRKSSLIEQQIVRPHDQSGDLDSSFSTQSTSGSTIPDIPRIPNFPQAKSALLKLLKEKDLLGNPDFNTKNLKKITDVNEMMSKVASYSVGYGLRRIKKMRR